MQITHRGNEKDIKAHGTYSYLNKTRKNSLAYSCNLCQIFGNYFPIVRLKLAQFE